MKNLLFSSTLFAIVTVTVAVTVTIAVMATVAVRQHLGPNDVARAVGMLKMGFQQHQVADILGVSQSVVARLWSRFQETGRYTRCPGQGRGRCTIDA